MITGEQVAKARILLGLTIATLAEEAALDRQMLEAFELGQSNLTAAQIGVLRDVLKKAGIVFLERSKQRHGEGNVPFRFTHLNRPPVFA